ncbi:hypothetical protein FUAX_54560 (plasmid) [Fulvitalea axinellae]|uniref:Tetratricopeptide repeat protein n=1 Tax=Fulvitalea axinellae TaxID=1182444 RepID=A0AAU9DEZ9_9BACT|nr:hypothetical protein FUAX_54560 [Fulvitalea axinellae]
MKFFERSLLLLALLVLVIHLVFFGVKKSPFVFATVPLSLAYFFGGYWILRDKKDKKSIFPALCGPVIASGLVALPFNFLSIALNVPNFRIVLLANFALAIAMVAFLLINRNTANNTRTLKKICWRSCLVALPGAFFLFVPHTGETYWRTVYIFLQNHERLAANIRMVDNGKAAKELLADKRYEEALECIEQATKSGHTWRNLIHYEYPDALTPQEWQAEARKILRDEYRAHPNRGSLRIMGGCYEVQYDVYRQYGDSLYRKKAFGKALNLYIKAYKTYVEFDDWKVGKSYVLAKIATCYDLANGPERYRESLYSKALDTHMREKGKIGADAAWIFFDRARAKTKNRKRFAEAEADILKALALLRKDGDPETYSKFYDGYIHHLCYNYMLRYEIHNLGHVIQELERKGENGKFKANAIWFLKGMKNYMQDDFIAANKCFSHYISGANDLNKMGSLLALVGRARSEYILGDYKASEIASRELMKKIKEVSKVQGVPSKLLEMIARTLLADVQLKQEKIEEAEKSYRKAVEIYPFKDNSQEASNLRAFIGLAHIDLARGQRTRSLERLDSISKRLANDKGFPMVRESYSVVAKIYEEAKEYDKATKLYADAMRNRPPQDKLTEASFYAGMARILYAKGDYREVEALSSGALSIYKEILPPDHPDLLSTQRFLDKIARDKP